MIPRHKTRVSALCLILFVLTCAPVIPATACEILKIQSAEFTVPIFLESDVPTEAIDISIEFDPIMLKVSDVTLAGGILDDSGYALVTNVRGGELTIVIYATDTLLPGSGEVLSVTFDSIGDSQGSSEVSLSAFKCNGQTASGGFHVSGHRCDSVSITEIRDVNNDGRIGLEEAIHGLRCVSGLRPCDPGELGLEKTIQALRIVSGIREDTPGTGTN